VAAGSFRGSGGPGEAVGEPGAIRSGSTGGTRASGSCRRRKRTWSRFGSGSGFPTYPGPGGAMGPMIGPGGSSVGGEAEAFSLAPRSVPLGGGTGTARARRPIPGGAPPTRWPSAGSRGISGARSHGSAVTGVGSAGVRHVSRPTCTPRAAIPIASAMLPQARGSAPRFKRPCFRCLPSTPHSPITQSTGGLGHLQFGAVSTGQPGPLASQPNRAIVSGKVRWCNFGPARFRAGICLDIRLRSVCIPMRLVDRWTIDPSLSYTRYISFLNVCAAVIGISSLLPEWRPPWGRPPALFVGWRRGVGAWVRGDAPDRWLTWRQPGPYNGEAAGGFQDMVRFSAAGPMTPARRWRSRR
jgi:hypothetical protein